MADSNREHQGEPSVLPGHTMMAEDGKGDSLVSSTTPLVTKCERGEEELGPQSLPQTYRASPPLVPPTSHAVAEDLPQTAITTVYASMAQPFYGESGIHRTLAMAGHQSYLRPDVSVSTADALPEQTAYVSGNVPLRSVSSTVMAQADYITAAEPIDFRRSSGTHAVEVNRMNAADGSEAERGGVSMIVEAGSQRVPHTSDMTRGIVPHIENLSRVTLPQTADIGRIHVLSDEMHRDIVQTGAISRMSSSQLREISKIGSSESEESNARNIPISVDAYRLNDASIGNSVIGVLESDEIIRRNTPVSDVDRRCLPVMISRGHLQESGHVDRVSMPSINEISALDSEAAALLAHESDKVWITVPISRQSVPYTDIGKMNTTDASRMSVPLTSDTDAVNTLNTCEAGGIVSGETGNVRTVVMSQLDDFSRINIPSSSGVISSHPNNDGSRIDPAVDQTTRMHGMDIKYSDLMARGSYSDGSRISVLQTHAGYEDERLTLAHLHETGDMSSQQAVDTKPIILPQTGDISIVAYPHAGEGVGTMAVSQTGNISMVILPQTGDVGQMTLAQGDVRRIDLLPADESNSTEIQTADGGRMNIQQNGNVIRISLPAPGDLSRVHMPHGDGLVQIQQVADVSRTVLPQTSDIRSSEVEEKVDVSKMILAQARDINAVEMQQKYDVSRGMPYQSGTIAKDSDINAVDAQHVYDVRTNKGGDINAVKSKRQNMFDVIESNKSRSSEMSSVERQRYHVGTSGLSQVGDIAANRQRMDDAGRTNLVSQAGDIAADRQRMYDAGRANLISQAAEIAADRQRIHDAGKMNVLQVADVEPVDRQQSYGIRTRVGQAAGGSSTEKQQMYDVARTGIPEAADVTAVDRQQMYIGRAESSQAGVEAAGSHHGMSVSHTQEASLMRMQQTPDLKMSSTAYTDSSVMTLPQTSGVKIVNIPATKEMIETNTARQPVSFDVKRMGGEEQPPPEYINMRVMAEAAEIISRGSVPADDINMRLMAETADFVSRNVPQTTVINSAGSTQQGMNSQNMAATTVSSKITLPQTDVTTKVLSNTSTSENVKQQDSSVKAANEQQTVIPSSITSEISSSNMTRTAVKKFGTVASVSQKSSPEKLKQRTGIRTDRVKPVDAGFRAEFLKSRSYVRWKDIGSSQGLHSDEEIACFLMKYYDNTSGVFPSGRSICSTCQRQLSVSCVNCSRKTEGDRRDAKKDNKKEKKSSNDRTKLWKLIVESAPKEEKGVEKGKEDKTENRHRRKPRQTRRVLRRRVIVSPSRSSDDDSQEEQNTDTHPNESSVPTKVHFEEERKNTPAPMETRKRGRPSNDSYHQASTLECPGCKRKFHTAVGLDQHVKRKRCKASKTAPSVSDDKEPEKNNTSPTSLLYNCSDCNKEYRSKQGLMLHRVSKHGDVDEKLQMVLPEEDDGDETDEYVPDLKDNTLKVFECSVCKKKYRSKQGLLMHKASKHSEEPDNKIKSETAEEISSAESGEDLKEKDSESFKCEECNKKYNSRPGYMLHMKTKHTPMVLRDCPECDGKFKTKVELRIHFRRMHNKGMLILFCPYCPLIFHSRDKLRSHMDDSHKTCRRVLFDCVACDLQFSSRIERKRHIQSEHKGKDTSLTCHFCGNWFATRHEYDEHEKSGHPEQTQEWLCAICGDSFPTRYLLQRHALAHKEKILCTLCNKHITEPCFEDHMKRHYGNKTWKCELCSKSFIRKAELQQHTLVHKNERPFCCEQCGMRYREKSRLNSHMRTHTGVKPYKCQQCEKCFTRSRELKNHMRVHTGEKPFACSVCGRKFASSGNLSAHRRKVHKLEPIPHGQQSRKHTLEECIKPENRAPAAPPPVTPMTTHQSPVAAHSDVALEIPVAHSGATYEMPADPGAAPMEVPLAHGAALGLQAPMAHKAPVAHQEQAVAYQQHVIPKYEPLVTQSEHYIPQPAVQQSPSSLAIYWPNASYGEES